MTEAWLETSVWQGATQAPLSGDASARRYHRLTRDDGATALLMEDPDRESFAAFERVAAHLKAEGFSAPAILLAEVHATGARAVIEDFGQTTLSALLARTPTTAWTAYQIAAEIPDALAKAPLPPWIARPDARAQAEMVHLTCNLAGCDPAPVVERLADALTAHTAGPSTLSLRDYHADNLMWLPARAGLRRIGLLDFQDAVALPLGYDLASLVDDPRRDVPARWRCELISAFAARHGLSRPQAEARIDTLSLLRNLRILGIFHRLATQGRRDAYRAFLPRTWALVQRAVVNPSLASLRDPVAALGRATQSWMP